MLVEYIYNNQELYDTIAFFRKLNDEVIEGLYSSSSYEKSDEILILFFTQDLSSMEQNLVISILQSLTLDDLQWELVRTQMDKLMSEPITILDKWRNQKETTSGETDIDETKAIEWADYLQDLRDIPTTETDPFDITWPTMPT